MSNVIRSHVRKSRKKYICDNCYSFIEKGSQYNYLFGSSFKGEKSYALRLCMRCKGEGEQK